MSTIRLGIIGVGNMGTTHIKNINEGKCPEVIVTAAKQDYRAFFEQEFSLRRNRLYPPFTILARLLVESPGEAIAQRSAESLHRRCADLLAEHPMWKKKTLLMRLDQPSVTVLRGKNRWQVLFKLLVSPAAEELCAALSEMAREKPEGAEVYFEYNPVTMM